MKQYFTVLDSFRGICACIVALSHFNAYSVINASPLLDHGSPYVDFFFVLSGFIIFANYQEKLQSGFKIRDFIWLRLGRLYPLHFMVLLAFVSVDVLQMLIDVGGAALYKPFSAPGESMSDIAAMFFLVHAMGATDTLALNGPSWSISTEFFCYILFAFIIVYIRKYTNLFILLCSLSCGAMLYVLAGELYAKLDFGFLRCVYGFGCGALTWSVYKSYIAPSEKNMRWFRKYASYVESAVFVVICVYLTFLATGALSFLAPFLFSGVIIVFAVEAGIISSILRKQAFLLIGTLSYSIYMIHMFIKGQLFELPFRILESKYDWQLTLQVDDVTLFGTNLINGTLLELFYLSVVIICSYISYKIIEEPCRKLSKKWQGMNSVKLH